MPSIESSNPLVFKTNAQAGLVPADSAVSSAGRHVALRVAARSLEGMQKEALVSMSSSSDLWRVVSDEGPYLNGTDLAPFPLAFFTAGTQFSLMSELVRLMRSLRVKLRGLCITQDSYYSMEGSFLRGDATGGAFSPEINIRLECDAEPDLVRGVLRLALATSPAHAVLHDRLENTFALTLNGRVPHLTIPDGLRPSREVREDPSRHFLAVAPVPDRSFRPDIISKVSAAERRVGVAGGVGSSLTVEQKRTLHVHGEGRLLEGLLMETEVRLVKPIGSSFRFVADEIHALGGKGSAPPPLAYVAAGVGFCFMTQLGRYANIVKQPLRSCRIVQENVFRLEGSISEGTACALAEPFDTQVFLESDISDEDARRFVVVGERTCFLHASMRGNYPANVGAELNGTEL